MERNDLQIGVAMTSAVIFRFVDRFSTPFFSHYSNEVVEDFSLQSYGKAA